MRTVLTSGLLVLLVSTAAGPVASADGAESSQVMGPNGHLYQRFDDTMTWHGATEFCAGLGGHLATVTSPEEDDFVYDNLASASPHEMVWLGASDEAVEGTWAWVNGEAWAYTNWAGGEPNNCSEIEHHLVYFTPNDPFGRAGYWNDVGVGLDGGCGCGGCVDEWYPMSTVCEWDLAVEIDIKPGSDPNSINCSNEEGVVTVAVLATDHFDATVVDHTTVTLEGASETHVAKKTGEPRRHEEDVDGDGDIDLVFHFRLGDTSLTCGSTMGMLIGETHEGIPFQASDRVRMVPPGACGATPDSAGVSCQDILDRCPGTPSGERWIAPDGTDPILAYCHMDEAGNGWTLVYNRNNAYFSPDHMYHELPAQGPDFSTNSTSWFIPNDATRWRWEVSVDSGASYRTLETSIPPEARATTHATVENAPISDVYENTTGASGPFYFQTIVYSDRCLYGCGSGMASWWGIVNVSQGAGDQTNPGLGGHTDSCSLDSMLLPGDNYTWGDGDLELYLSDWKDVGGDGIGGTNCVPDAPTTEYRYRLWAR